ncbi:hypothetical protein [Rhodoblastus sp.]|uniref:hypothetical protein n=1 Tax=Rhodoblastus sp. TaxID=1962975 RepID=UPI003F9E4171
MSISLISGSGSTVANVDPTSNGLIVQDPKTATQAGFSGMVAIRDQGSVTGTPNIGLPDITNNRRLRVSLDTPVFQDQFNYTAQNTNNWSVGNSTMTTAYTGGAMILNSGSSVAASVWNYAKTYRSFPLYTAGELVLEVRCMLSAAAQVNNACYMGIGIPGTTAAPTDGVYFQLDTTGTLRGVMNWNGTITETSPLTAPSPGVSADMMIVIDDGVAEFWINGILQGSLNSSLLAGAATPSYNAAGQVFFQIYNAASAPAFAQQIKVQNVQVTLYGLNTSKPWPHIKGGEGLNALVGQNGGTMGSTELYANSTNPTAALPTNTTAALGSGLGGNFWETATLAVNTDGIISSYQNPAGSISQTPRNLYITGLRWFSMVQTVLAGGPFVYECGLAFGHTAVSLATTEAATTKAPRKFAVGLYTLAATAAVGTPGAAFVHNFATPILVQPGEFIQTIVRNIGTIGTSGTIAHHIGFEGYWE